MSKLRLPPRSQRSEAAHFTIDQLNRILALAEEPWRTLYCILTLEGLRAGEALGLQWGDIDFDSQILHVRRSAWYRKVQAVKTRSSETVLPIPASLLEVLKNYRREWKPNPDGFLFATRNGRPPSSNKVVEYNLWAILDALKIPTGELITSGLHRKSGVVQDWPSFCARPPLLLARFNTAALQHIAATGNPECFSEARCKLRQC